jgi:serine/threonine protein kinase
MNRAENKLARIKWKNGTFLRCMHKDGGGDAYLAQNSNGAMRICKFPWPGRDKSIKDYRAERRALQHLNQTRFRMDPRIVHCGRILEVEHITVLPASAVATSGGSDTHKPVDKVSGSRHASKIPKELKHPAVATQVEAMFLEYYPGVDLYRASLKHGDRLTRTQIREITRQLALAVSLLHSAGIMHLDIKPENICFTTPWEPRKTRALVNGGVPCLKLVDYGLSEFTNEPTDDIVGTDAYLAPEINKGKVHTPAIDIWCIGMLMYELAMVNEDELDDDAVISSYRDLDYKSKHLRSALGDDGVDLFKSILVPYPKDRPSADDVVAHAYLKDHNYNTSSDSDDDDDDDFEVHKI